jgi:hypothetical protein
VKGEVTIMGEMIAAIGIIMALQFPSGPVGDGQAAAIVVGTQPGNPNFYVPPPSTPKGPSTGMIGQKLSYSTEGTDPLNVHLYQYDWGDGSPLKWGSKKQSHIYTHTGRFSIKVKEKCPAEFFITDFSKVKTVNIIEPILRRQG